MRTSVIILIIITSVSLVQAEQNWQPSGSLSLELNEKYLTYTSSRNVYDDTNLLGTLSLNLPAGFNLGVCERMDLADSDLSSTSGDNLDFVLGWNGKIGKYKINTTAILLNFQPLDDYLHGDRTIYSVAVSRSYLAGRHIITPNLNIRWWSPSRQPKAGHLVGFGGSSHTWKISPMVTFRQDLKLVWDSAIGSETDRSEFFLRWSPGLSWKIGKRASLTLPSLTVLTPLSNPDDGRNQTETSWGCKISYQF